MKFIRSMAVFLTGIGVGIITVLSCGDDSPRRADANDAAMCTCPAAEPPLANRIKEVVKPLTVPANSMGQDQSVGCPVDAVVLNGGCAANEGQVPNLILEQSAPDGVGWNCTWRNPSNIDIPVRAIVRCLMPAQ